MLTAYPKNNLLFFHDVVNRQNIKEGKEAHDLLYKNIDHKWITIFPRLRSLPFSTDFDQGIVNERQNLFKKFDSFHQNLIPQNKSWYAGDLMSRMEFFYKERIQILCSGHVSIICLNFEQAPYIIN